VVRELVSSGEAGRSSDSGSVESSLPAASSEASFGAVVALNCRGSASVQCDNQKHTLKRKYTEKLTIHLLEP
jgi:hypothetical protein